MSSHMANKPGPASALLAAVLWGCLCSVSQAQGTDVSLIKGNTIGATLESSAKSECVQTTFNITSYDAVEKQVTTGNVLKRSIVYIFFQTVDMCARQAVTFGAALEDFSGLLLRKQLDYATLDYEQPATEVRRCHIEGTREVCEQVIAPVSIHLRWTPNGEFFEVHGSSSMRMGANYISYRGHETVKMADVTYTLSIAGEAPTLDVMEGHLAQVKVATLNVTPSP